MRLHGKRIVKEGFASEDAAERIADAVGLTAGKILLPEITGNAENIRVRG